MIEVEHLTKRRGRTTVLSDVTFEARPGRVTGFLGRNGAGKSSTLRVILGLDRPHHGTALVAGRPFARWRHPLTVAGALLDEGGFHRSRTGRGHLRWMAASNGLPRSRVDEVLALVGLTDAAGRRIGRYSLGMTRRLGLAGALLGDPGVLILDEPVNGLDPDGIRWMRGFLRERAAAGGTVLLSSHLMTELAETADDIVVIDRGGIVAAGSLADVTGRHGTLEEAYFALTGPGDQR